MYGNDRILGIRSSRLNQQANFVELIDYLIELTDGQDIKDRNFDAFLDEERVFTGPSNTASEPVAQTLAIVHLAKQ